MSMLAPVQHNFHLDHSSEDPGGASPKGNRFAHFEGVLHRLETKLDLLHHVPDTLEKLVDLIEDRERDKGKDASSNEKRRRSKETKARISQDSVLCDVNDADRRGSMDSNTVKELSISLTGAMNHVATGSSLGSGSSPSFAGHGRQTSSSGHSGHSGHSGAQRQVWMEGDRFSSKAGGKMRSRQSSIVDSLVPGQQMVKPNQLQARPAGMSMLERARKHSVASHVPFAGLGLNMLPTLPVPLPPVSGNSSAQHSATGSPTHSVGHSRPESARHSVCDVQDDASPSGAPHEVPIPPLPPKSAHRSSSPHESGDQHASADYCPSGDGVSNASKDRSSSKELEIPKDVMKEAMKRRHTKSEGQTVLGQSQARLSDSAISAISTSPLSSGGHHVSFPDAPAETWATRATCEAKAAAAFQKRDMKMDAVVAIGSMGSETDLSGEISDEEEFPSLIPHGIQQQSTKASQLLRPGMTSVSLYDGQKGTSLVEKLKLPPDARIRMVWDMLIIVNIVCISFLLPLLVVYYDFNEDPDVSDFFLLYFMDLLWPIDILMNLITGFYVGGEVEHGHREIAKHYANTWLIPDLLAACPLVLASHSQEAFVVLSILKIPRLMQLPYRFFHLRSNIGSYSSGLPWLIVVGGFLGLHLISCGWRITLRADGDEPAHIHDDVFKKWVDDAYWTSMTLTSVGYGDVVPIGNVSKLYSILVMILGSTICGAFVGSFSFFLQKVVNNESEQRMAELSSFMRRRSVPKDLQRKVRHNLKQHLTEPAAMAPQLLVQLSPSMQRELCLAILNDTVLGFPLFRHAQRSFVAELAQAHCWEQILPGDIVADEGQSLQEVVFLIEGSLQAWVRPGFMELDAHISALFVSECSSSAECIVIRIKAGAWFGEASLFQDEHVYTASVSALTRCEVALLPSAKYIAILQRYPWLYERHQSLVKKIEEGTIKLLSLKYRDPEEARRSKTKNGGFKRNMTHYFGQRASAKPGKRSSNSS